MKILPIISISHLYFANIYKDFSLNIPANTNFAICGENGTGKTSLIKILCDLLTLDKGSVVFRGMNKNHKTIGYCSQHTTWPNNLKVKTLLELLIKIHNQTLPQIFNISLYKDLLIDTIINFKLKHLSGGQTRRLALFLALFYNPRIVFLDESFNDIDQRKITISIIKKYCQVHQIQIILISHSVYEISQLTNAGVFLVRNQKKSKIYSTQQLSKILVSQFKN